MCIRDSCSVTSNQVRIDVVDYCTFDIRMLYPLSLLDLIVNELLLRRSSICHQHIGGFFIIYTRITSQTITNTLIANHSIAAIFFNLDVYKRQVTRLEDNVKCPRGTYFTPLGELLAECTDVLPDNRPNIEQVLARYEMCIRDSGCSASEL